MRLLKPCVAYLNYIKDWQMVIQTLFNHTAQKIKNIFTNYEWCLKALGTMGHSTSWETEWFLCNICPHYEKKSFIWLNYFMWHSPLSVKMFDEVWNCLNTFKWNLLWKMIWINTDTVSVLHPEVYFSNLSTLKYIIVQIHFVH